MDYRKRIWVPVVAGFIKKKDLLLVGKRPENKNLSLLWEFPGGKMELGEKPEETLARELFEELSIKAEIGSLKFATSHNFGETGILLLFYEVKYWVGEPKPLHHMEIKWVHPDELKHMEIPEANRLALDRLLEVV